MLSLHIQSDRMSVCEPSHLTLAVLVAKGLVHQPLIIAFLLDSLKAQEGPPHFAT